MSRSTLKPKGAAQITVRDILSAGSSFLKGVGGVAATLLNTTSAQAGQLSSEQQREEMRSHGDLSKEEFDKINASQDGGELPTIEQSSKPKGAAQNRSTLKPIGLKPLKVEPIASEKLDLSGLITMPSPIKVVKDNKVITEYRDPTQNWHDELGNYVARENALKRNVEQGSIPGFDPSQLTEDDTPPVRPGNTKMQDFRAKGEAIINKAKKEGRMLSEIEQMKVKRMRGKYENEYKKSK